MLPYQCIYCKNYLANSTCRAYPNAIPEVILTNQVEHIKPMFGQDNDFIYGPIEGITANIIQMPLKGNLDIESIKDALKAAIKIGVD